MSEEFCPTLPTTYLVYISIIVILAELHLTVSD